MKYLEKIDALYTALKTTILSFVIFGIGISQAIYGWIGDALWMRLLYGIAGPVMGGFLLLFGLAQFYIEVAGIPDKPDDESVSESKTVRSKLPNG